MNELYFTINFSKQKFIINGVDLISGDYNSTKIKFNFEDYKEGTKVIEIRPALSEDKNPTFMSTITNNEVILTSIDESDHKVSPFTTGGVYLVEVSVYGNDSKLSTITKSLNILEEQIILSDDILTPYLPIFDELIQEINTAITETNNLNITITKENGVTTITLTKKDGTVETFNILDGIDGTDGVGISNIAKITTVGLVDTYRITLTDGSYYDYQITNGKGIVSITKTDTTEYTDTYTITYNDGTTTTFTVTNGTLTIPELYQELSYITNILPKVSGTGSNITLNNTGDSRLLELEIEGKSIQDGTPTPNNPVEIKSVGYENLFDISTVSLNTYIASGDGTTGTSGVSNTSDFIEINKNTNYILKYEYNTLVNTATRGLVYFNNNKQYISGISYNPIYKLTTLTTPANARYVRFSYDKNCTNIMVTKGTQDHNYIPYSKFGIEIKSVGKNLFDGQLEIGSYNSSGNKSIDNNRIRSTNFIQVKPNTNYIFSEDGNGIALYIQEYNNNFEFIQRVLRNSVEHLTTTANTKYITFRTYSETTDTTKKIQLEEGTQITTYEPYQENIQLYTLDNPLRAIGNVKDRLYIENGTLKVERKIGKVILDGTETMYYSNYSDPYYRIKVKIDGKRTNSDNTQISGLISNYFKAGKWNSGTSQGESVVELGGVNGDDGAYFIINKNQLADTSTHAKVVESFSSWLSTYNTEVQYILAEPYTEEIGQVDIPLTYYPITNIMTTDSLNPILNVKTLKDISNL